MTRFRLHRLLRKKHRFAALAIAVFAVGAFAGVASLTPAAPPDPALSHVSNIGVPIAPPTTDEPALTRANQAGQAKGPQFVLGTRGDRAFYRIENGDGSDCFAVGPVAPAGYRFGQIQCGEFPSADRPVLAFVMVQGDASAAPPQVTRAEGVAVDAVTTVAFADPSGSYVARTPVQDNLFRFETIPEAQFSALDGLDAAGNIVYSLQLG